MGFSVHWSWFAVLTCLLCLGCEVWCDCTDTQVQMVGGNFTLTKGLQRGSLLVYNCPEGYYPYPHLARVCQANGAWRPAPKRNAQLQRCRLMECPDPSVLEYGYVSPPQERYFLDNVTTYECYSGYTMRGSNRRVCLPNGKWSGSTPICSRDSGAVCADPGIPAGATRTGSIFGIDEKVKYTCNGQLFLVGSSERVCQENGQWSGKEPACYYQHTYDTPLEVSQAFGSAIQETLTTLQSTDDTQGERKIRISKNETLNIYIAVDISESIKEEHFNSAKDAIIKLIKKIASFSVTPNYDILFFSADIYEIVNILNFLDGSISLHTVIKKLEDFKVGDKSTGTDVSLVFKTFEERMAVIKQRTGEKFQEQRHVIIFFTDGAYNMGGSPLPTVEKIKNMVYMNPKNEQERQAREDFLDIYVFAIGAEIYDLDLQPLTVGTGGRHYFRLKDIQELQETFDEIIDEGAVKGLCGLHREYDTGTKDSIRKMYPWWAYIVVQNEKIKKCLGSLVTSKFILTAAHCFTFGDLPEHVTVEIDDGLGRVKRVKTFYIHPNYNVNAKVDEGVKEFYDYDVALIQLQDDVQISTSTRPICIPCTRDTSDALQLVGESTCKQQEQLLLKNHLERLSFLTKTGRSIEEKDVHAKLGSNRDECIVHALEAEGITTENPKVAVTDNFLCTGGTSPFRDHIACTGDSGGAVFKNFEHRTIQIAVVSWGSASLCKSGGLFDSRENSRDFHLNLFRVIPFLKSILANDAQDDYAPLVFLEN